MMPINATSAPATQRDPQLMTQVSKAALADLGNLVGVVLARADDWLFDRTNKDSSQTDEQSIEAMRLLRAGRQNIQTGFMRHFEQGFQAISGVNPDNFTAPPALSLVSSEDLDLHLACEVIAYALTRHHGPALDALNHRLAAVAGVKVASALPNPLSATSLAEGMKTAQDGVNLSENFRVVLFKLYERELLSTLGPMLSKLNAQLLAAGVLPHLGNPNPVDPDNPALKAERPPQSPVEQPQGYASAQAPNQGASVSGAPGGAQHGDFSQGPADEQATFDALRGLLQNWRARSWQGTNGQTEVGGMRFGHATRPLAANEIMSLLNMLQPSVPSAVQQALNNNEASLAQLMKAEMIQHAVKLGIAPDQVNISGEHEDAVDLVSMLFDVLFDERDLPAQGKTMISRLVVPYVKAAVLDRKLFQYKTHPARRLLNSLSEAVEGNNGEGAHEKELLKKASDTVDRLVAEFNEDIAIFETLEQELRAFLEQHNRRIEASERRNTEAQRGAERLEHAKHAASLQLSLIAKGQPLPQALADFLTGPWSHHASMVALRGGEGGAVWNAAVDLATALVSTVASPNADPTLVFHTMLPAMTAVMGSSGITGTPVEQEAQALANAIRAFRMSPAQNQPAPVISAPTPPLVLAASKERLDFDEADVAVMRGLAVGTWLELAGEDGKLHSAKLSWVSPISSRLMFVNKRGARILVASVEELAAMKKKGNLTLRTPQPAFEHAIHQMMGKLQTVATATA